MFWILIWQWWQCYFDNALAGNLQITWAKIAGDIYWRGAWHYLLGEMCSKIELNTPICVFMMGMVVHLLVTFLDILLVLSYYASLSIIYHIHYNSDFFSLLLWFFLLLPCLNYCHQDSYLPTIFTPPFLFPIRVVCHVNATISLPTCTCWKLRIKLLVGIA